MTARNRLIGAIASSLFGATALFAADLDCSKGKGDVPAPNAALNANIQHVIVLMQENRSWDSYYGMIDLPQCGQEAAGQSCVDKLPPQGATNPDPTDLSKTIASFHQTLYCTEDTAHGWDSSHVEYNRTDPNAPDGFNDGFTTANVSAADPTGHRSMGYYDGTDINYYWDLVRLFSFGDRYFSSSLDSTYPNREYLLAATSFGHITNDLPPIPNGFPVDSIFTRLDAAGITWKDYFLNLPQAGLVYGSPNTHFVPMPVFFADLATCLLPSPVCQLPQVSFVDPAFLLVGLTGLESTDEHPQNDIQEGQAFVAAVVDALIASPVWKQSVLFLTYDEAGGFYDHVVPPPACVPDDFAPGHCADTPDGACTNLGTASSNDPAPITVGFDRYGFRVPNAVISPWVKPGYVSHQVHDHTSILKFIETRFGLGALTHRDANADDMLDYFDFDQDPSSAKLFDASSVLQTLPVPAFDPLRALMCLENGPSTSDELPSP